MNVPPAPTTPHSQSFAARRLQKLEKHIGTAIDLVIESPWHSGVLASRQSLITKPIAPPILQDQMPHHVYDDHCHRRSPLLVCS
jgi:hypothetical protein